MLIISTGRVLVEGFTVMHRKLSHQCKRVEIMGK